MTFDPKGKYVLVRPESRTAEQEEAVADFLKKTVEYYERSNTSAPVAPAGEGTSYSELQEQETT